MILNVQLKDSIVGIFLWGLGLSLTAFFLSGCTGPTTAVHPQDRLPMFGQPTISRSSEQQMADEKFTKESVTTYGNREKASLAWWQKGEKFMEQYRSKSNESPLDYAMLRYNQAWLLDPTYYAPYWGFSRVLMELGKYDQALVHLKKAEQLINDPYQRSGSFIRHKYELHTSSQTPFQRSGAKVRTIVRYGTRIFHQIDYDGPRL